MRRFALPRAAVLAALALVAGLAAAWLLDRHVSQRVAGIEARAKVPMVERIVAAHDLPAGTRLRTEHLALRAVPRDWANSDSLRAADHPLLQDQTLAAPLRAGDLLLRAHVQAPGTAFSSQLALGRRAITLPVDQINSLSGLLQPGDLIDLYVSFDHQRRKVTAPLLQGVLVLATGRSTLTGVGEAPGDYSTVTLDAAPEDVVKLVAARQGGSITAILRHPDDPQADRRAVRGDLAALLGVPSIGAPGPRRKSAPVLYGNGGAARVGPLQAPAAAPPMALFDLPQSQALASAWMQSVGMLSADDAPPDEDAP